MPKQHTTEERSTQEAILVPLDLAGFQMVSQEWLTDGTMSVEVIATTTQARCPHCHKACVKIPDTRPRKKRDRALREHRVEVIVLKRRFRCLSCRKSFTDPDTVCGWRKQTTARWREEIGKCAYNQPLSHVATALGVGPHFVQECFQSVALQELKEKGLNMDEQQPLDTPEFLGSDEFARRKGHVYETILCDVGARQVLEVWPGRKLDEVSTLLERLREPDAVKAVSMDMTASYRPAVQLCLPKAHIVADHFHVIQHVMKAFKKIVSSWAHKKEGKPLLQGKPHLFLTAKEELTEEQVQARTQIGRALPVLEAAWHLKEAFRTWYATATALTAADGLDTGIEQVQTSGFDPLRKALSAFGELETRNSGLFPVFANAPFQWLRGRQEQSHQGSHAARVWLS